MASLLLVLPTMNARGQSRPDLAELTFDTFTSNNAVVGRTNNLLVSAHKASGSKSQALAAFGGRFVMNTANSHGGILWSLFEPDKVTRKATGVTLQQTAYTFITVFGTTVLGGTYSANGSVPGCKSKASVKGTTAAWQVSCPGTTLATLGLSASQQAAFAKLFGSTTVKVQGKKSP
jgi:hypothetical protein